MLKKEEKMSDKINWEDHFVNMAKNRKRKNFYKIKTGKKEEVKIDQVSHEQQTVNRAKNKYKRKREEDKEDNRPQQEKTPPIPDFTEDISSARKRQRKQTNDINMGNMRYSRGGYIDF